LRPYCLDKLTTELFSRFPAGSEIRPAASARYWRGSEKQVLGSLAPARSARVEVERDNLSRIDEALNVNPWSPVLGVRFAVGTAYCDYGLL